MEESPEVFEQKYVHAVYDLASTHFALTRRTRPWPIITDFLSTFPTGSLLLDVGCGEGRYSNCMPSLTFVGVDMSQALLEIAHGGGASTEDDSHMFEHSSSSAYADHASANAFVRASALVLPVVPASADGLVCIAMLHHLSSRQRRVAAVAELVRALRPGGRGVLSVFATRGAKRCRELGGGDTFVAWSVDARFVDDEAKVAQCPQQPTRRLQENGRVSLEMERYYHMYDSRDEIVGELTEGGAEVTEVVEPDFISKKPNVNYIVFFKRPE